MVLVQAYGVHAPSDSRRFSITNESSDSLQTSHPGFIPEPDHLMAPSWTRLCGWDMPIGQLAGSSSPNTPSPWEVTSVCFVTGLQPPILLLGRLRLLIT